ncbi:MAG: hypothetical protein QGG36_33135 [Pirellulaceae bacterium]|jgi:hypothetical protein|nr:hypothetical protein [Pirellulaceae bacterium]MDP7020678.1 hypothetical protein [Pirellulaceae bacterium]
MNDSPQSPDPLSNGWFALQIVAGAAVMGLVAKVFGVYWSIPSVPILFALFVMLNYANVDSVTERRLKRCIHWLTIASAVAAVIYLYGPRWLELMKP